LVALDLTPKLTPAPRSHDDAVLTKSRKKKRGARRSKAPPPSAIGQIRIPKIGLEHPIYEGIDMSILNHGPGHWPYTAVPGDVGNTVFPGHRVTNTHPFLYIDRLEPGDEVTFETQSGIFTYEVTQTMTVNPDDFWITDQTNYPSMTIFGCHPPHSDRQRYVAKGRLVREWRPASSTPAPEPTPTPAPPGPIPTLPG
jgi:sortase A